MEQLQITIFEKRYYVNFPTVDQFIQIETMKMSLSNGMYGQMMKAQSRTTNMALDLIDAFATFLVLLPEMKVDGGLPDDINSLTPEQITQLLIAFKTQYYPWFNRIMKSIEDQVKQAQKALNDAESQLQEETSSN
jgi:hypothetical protein